MKHFTIIIVIAVSLSGCVQRIGDFTVASTKNIDIKRTLHTVDESERLTGQDKKHIILFIPTGQPSMKEAMDNAIEKRARAVGLSNVTVKSSFWWIPYIYGQTSFEVEGNPVYENK